MKSLDIEEQKGVGISCYKKRMGCVPAVSALLKLLHALQQSSIPVA